MKKLILTLLAFSLCAAPVASFAAKEKAAKPAAKEKADKPAFAALYKGMYGKGN